MRFLVVDQMFESRTDVKKVLLSFGDVDIALDGEECILAFIVALKEGVPYDLITLDALMPYMDGEQTLREIREIEKEYVLTGAKPLTHVILTSEARKEEIFNAFCFGKSSVYMKKPICPDCLRGEVNKLMALNRNTKEI